MILSDACFYAVVLDEQGREVSKSAVRFSYSGAHAAAMKLLDAPLRRAGEVVNIMTADDPSTLVVSFPVVVG